MKKSFKDSDKRRKTDLIVELQKFENSEPFLKKKYHKKGQWSNSNLNEEYSFIDNRKMSKMLSVPNEEFSQILPNNPTRIKAFTDLTAEHSELYK
mmetsp:Transcript_27552/g.24419  ORF Transcript_27552/g.24419 Transcript_27552/m.24419 type:complete len:95 (+) Transcript_27552:3-287(+)